MGNRSQITDYILLPEGRLVYKAKEFGYHPQVILAGRAVTDAPSVMSNG